MKLLAATSESIAGCAYHRVIMPCLGIKQYFPNDCEVMVVNKFPTEIPADVTHVLFNRYAPSQNGLSPANQLTILKNSKAKIIVDIDDYWHLHDHHPMRYNPAAYQEWQNTVINSILNADIIWTSTPTLKQHLEAFVPKTPVYLVRNTIPPAHLDSQWTPRPRKLDSPLIPKSKSFRHRTVMGWAGSVTHRGDFDILPQFASLVNKNKLLTERLGYAIGGYNQTQFFQEVGNYLLKPVLPQLEPPPLRFYPILPVFEYANFLDNCSFMFAPLLDTEFNRSKSELKILEAAAKRKPIIASRVGAFAECNSPATLVDHDDYESWYNHVIQLVNSHTYAKTQADNLHEWLTTSEQYNLKNLSEIRLNSIQK